MVASWCAFGEGDFGEDVAVVFPCGVEALEGGAVVVALGGEVLVGVVEGEGLGAGGWPGGGMESVEWWGVGW